MIVHQEECHLAGTPDTDVLEVTERVVQVVQRSGVRDGTALVFTPGSTAGVTTLEFEPGVVEDLKRALERLAPRDIPYAHHAAWDDGNGHSHVRAALLGPSIAVPVQDGALLLGTWQQIVVVDFDVRPRRRRVLVQVLGTRRRPRSVPPGGPRR